MSSYPTYEEWKPGSLSLLYMDTWILVLILPMRNGNKSSSVGSCRQNIVLILPMRNGNGIPASSTGDNVQCSYPTYEEWKLLFVSKILVTRHCSYPTYEEWKPAQPSDLYISFISSYPTYEEWKLGYTYNRKLFFFVLILPMRNGN